MLQKLLKKKHSNQLFYAIYHESIIKLQSEGLKVMTEE